MLSAIVTTSVTNYSHYGNFGGLMRNVKNAGIHNNTVNALYILEYYALNLYDLQATRWHKHNAKIFLKNFDIFIRWTLEIFKEANCILTRRLQLVHGQIWWQTIQKTL